MKTKALPIVIASLVLIGTAAGPAQAQTKRKVTLEASVPFEFVVGSRTFPAGSYIFEMATGAPKKSDQAGILVVRNRERKLYVAVATGVTADEGAHAAHNLVFVRNGDRTCLAKVWRQGDSAGLSLHTAPGATEAEDWEESRFLVVDAARINGGE